MTADEYERHVVGLLCWACHRATHRSSGRQRECPGCGRRPSYHRLRVEWGLAKAFALQAPAGRAARVVGCSQATAARAFAEFRAALAAATDAGPRQTHRLRLQRLLGVEPAGSGSGPPQRQGSVTVFIVTYRARVYALPTNESPIEAALQTLRAARLAAAAFLIPAGEVPAKAKFGGSTRPTDRGRGSRSVVGFWGASAGVLRSCRAATLDDLALYLAECEFRFANGDGRVLDEVYSRVISAKADSSR